MNLTKKTTYLTLACVFALSSCNGSDEPQPGAEPVGREIIFSTDFPYVESRAEILGNTLPYFQVTAFNPSDSRLLSGGVLDTHFSNERINIEAGSDRHTSSACRWPDQGRETDELTFFAFYPELPSGAKLVNNSSASVFDYKLQGFRVNAEIADQVDFVTACATGNMATNAFYPISLRFAHQLSRIEVNAWSAHKTCDIEIAGIRFGGIGVEGTFAFSNTETGGAWYGEPTERGIVEYIFKPEDRIISLLNSSTGVSTNKEEGAVSIMGSKIGDDNNCAMLIPSTYPKWDAEGDGRNAANKMYISVLLRITDVTVNAGIKPTEKQRFPYRDYAEGPQALDIPKVYMAVTKDGVVSKRLYKKEDAYFTDSACKASYAVPANEEVKEFGWAAIPVSADWKPGNIYSYTLDYTSGVGLLDPEVTTTYPKAGEPVISGKVAVTYEVKPWRNGGGDEFVMPPI